jgi:hypothetical protein
MQPQQFGEEFVDILAVEQLHSVIYATGPVVGLTQKACFSISGSLHPEIARLH